MASVSVKITCHIFFNHYLLQQIMTNMNERKWKLIVKGRCLKNFNQSVVIPKNRLRFKEHFFKQFTFYNLSQHYLTGLTLCKHWTGLICKCQNIIWIKCPMFTTWSLIEASFVIRKASGCKYENLMMMMFCEISFFVKQLKQNKSPP